MKYCMTGMPSLAESQGVGESDKETVDDEAVEVDSGHCRDAKMKKPLMTCAVKMCMRFFTIVRAPSFLIAMAKKFLEKASHGAKMYLNPFKVW